LALVFYPKTKKENFQKGFLLLELLIGIGIWWLVIAYSSIFITQFSKSTAKILTFNQKVRNAQNAMEMDDKITSPNEIVWEPYQEHIYKKTVIIDAKHRFEVLRDDQS